MPEPYEFVEPFLLVLGDEGRFDGFSCGVQVFYDVLDAEGALKEHVPAGLEAIVV